MMKDKLRRFVEKIEETGRPRPSETSKPHKFSVVRLTFMPFGILAHNFKSFFLLCCVFAPLMAILAFATNNSLICGLGDDMAEQSPFACAAPNNAVYVTFLLLRLLNIGVFLKSWYRVAVKGETVYVRDLLVINAQDWKLFALLLFIMFLNVLPFFSLMLLVNRVPNPDWQVESLYFAVVSCGFWLPFVALRFYCIPAFVVENSKLPSMKQIIHLTADNGLKQLFSFVVVVVFCTLLMLYFMNFSNFLIAENPFVFGILGEVLYDMVLLALMTLLLNYSVTLRQEMFAADGKTDAEKL